MTKYTVKGSTIGKERNKFTGDSSNNVSVRTISPNSDAFLAATLTLKFWECTGVDCSSINFITLNAGEPVISNEGAYILES